MLPPAHRLAGPAQLFLLAALTTLSPFSNDTFVPALEAVARGLDATAAQAQQTLSAYMFGVALMALFHGAIADAVGRRPVMLASLGVYAAASLGCAVATDIHLLVGLRFIQGLSGGAGMILVRAMIRDTLDGPPAQRMLSQVMFVFAVAPAIAPIIGGFFVVGLGWRAIFWFFFAGSTALLVWAAIALPETLPKAKRTSLAPRSLLQGYASVFLRSEFYALTITGACAFQAFFQYIGAANALLKGTLGLKETQFGYLFVPIVAGFMIGSVISGHTAGRWTRRRTMYTAFVVIFVPIGVNVIYHLLAPPTMVSSIAPIALTSIGIAMMSPIIQIMVLDLFPDRRGMAASAQACLQLTVGAVDLALIALALGGSVLVLALGQLGWALASLAAWLIYLRIHGRH